MTDELETPVVQAEANKAIAPKPVRKTSTAGAAKASAKPAPRLGLPKVADATGAEITVLEHQAKNKFKSLILVKHSDIKMKDGIPVLESNTLGHIARYVTALSMAWTSGTGSAADGCALYVDDYAKKVLDAAPQLKGYDVYLVQSQAGANAYRIPVTEMIAQVRQRASVIRTAIKQYGTKKVSHTKGEKSEPSFSL